MQPKGNSDLLQPGSQQASVAPIAAVTQDLGNTAVAQEKYYYCTMSIASFHRADGKKLPFINHFFKTSFKEDIEYLDKEVATGNPYIRHATAEEVSQAKLHEDPLGTVKEAVKKELSIEELEALLEARKKEVAAGKDPNADANKVAGVDKAAAANAVRAQGVQQHASATGANTAGLAGLVKQSGK